MLFDLQGKRRRVVQVTYLTLAILMGGGLVLFGIGGETTGGLVDAVTGNGSGGGSADDTIKKRIEADKKALKLNPRNTSAYESLVRSYYQLATDDADPNTGTFGEEGKAQLRKADAAWSKYVDIARKPDDSLAGLMLQAYGEAGLNQPAKATRAAEIVAEARPSAVAYLQLAQYAAQAGQTRKAELAGDKAIELAPKSQKKLVRQQIEAAKAQGAGAAVQGAAE